MQGETAVIMTNYAKYMGYAIPVPLIDRRRPAEWVDKADTPILCLSVDKVIVGLSVLSKSNQPDNPELLWARN